MYDEVDDLDPDSIEVVTIRLNDIQLVLVHNMLGLPLFNVTLNATNLDIKKEQGKMEGEHSSERAAREWSNCSWQFYYSSLFHTCFIAFVTFSSVVKHPNKSFLT